jgi:hypothetical protein
MWSGFDPELQKQFASIREMVALRHQTPTKEWPLIFIAELDALLVVREWPGGGLTAYATTERSERIRENSGS